MKTTEFTFKSIDPKSISTSALHAYLLGAIAPRPIAFASTIDKDGNVNLSPFSFFNVFGSNPPLLIFSPARRVRDNSIKHTLENVLESPEVVVNIVDFNMVEQASLASCEYEKGVNEFQKSGLTPLPSLLVQPPRVAESPASFECKVIQVIETGKEGGAGNLILCEIVMAHFAARILNEEGKVDTRKLDAVARMGGDWYCRAFGDALFELPKPNAKLGVGFEKLPKSIIKSEILSGNNLGRLANIEAIPTEEEVRDVLLHSEGIKYYIGKPVNIIHERVKELIVENDIKQAWMLLLATEK